MIKLVRESNSVESGAMSQGCKKSWNIRSVQQPALRLRGHSYIQTIRLHERRFCKLTAVGFVHLNECKTIGIYRIILPHLKSIIYHRFKWRKNSVTNSGKSPLIGDCCFIEISVSRPLHLREGLL